MHPLVGLAIVVALDAAVIYLVADDVLSLQAPISGMQSFWLGLSVAVVPALVFAAL